MKQQMLRAGIYLSFENGDMKRDGFKGKWFTAKSADGNTFVCGYFFCPPDMTDKFLIMIGSFARSGSAVKDGKEYFKAFPGTLKRIKAKVFTEQDFLGLTMDEAKKIMVGMTTVSTAKNEDGILNHYLLQGHDASGYWELTCTKEDPDAETPTFKVTKVEYVKR